MGIKRSSSLLLPKFLTDPYEIHVNFIVEYNDPVLFFGKL